jgi:hypothetical protein
MKSFPVVGIPSDTGFHSIIAVEEGNVPFPQWPPARSNRRLV